MTIDIYFVKGIFGERWLFALIKNAVRHGLVTREEVENGLPAPSAPKLTPPLRASMVAESPATRHAVNAEC